MLKAQQIVVNPVTGERLQVITTGDETNGTLLEIDFFLAPHKGEVSLAHRQDTDEIWTVIDGVATYQLDGIVHSLQSSETLVIPKGASHKNPWNASDGVLHLRRTIRLDVSNVEGMRTQLKFFETNYALAQQGKVEADGLPKDLLQMVVILHAVYPHLYLANMPLGAQHVLFGILAAVGRALGYQPFYEVMSAS